MGPSKKLAFVKKRLIYSLILIGIRDGNFLILCQGSLKNKYIPIYCPGRIF